MIYVSYTIRIYDTYSKFLRVVWLIDAKGCASLKIRSSDGIRFDVACMETGHSVFSAANLLAGDYSSRQSPFSKILFPK